MSEKKLVMSDDELNNVVGGQADFSDEPAESPSRPFPGITKVLCPECNEVLLYRQVDNYIVPHSITTDCRHCGKRVTVWA